jgi:two-component sensor histidine kinase
MQESVYRVRSMALIHQQLYGVESLERIDLGEYARALTAFLQAALAPGTRIGVTTDDVLVTIETAVPIGLILNELLTNAFKYGKPLDPEIEPQVDVSVNLLGDGDDARIVIAIRDNGPGLPDGFDIELAQSLGLQLVSALILQLRGQLVIQRERGACLELSCPLKQD